MFVFVEVVAFNEDLLEDVSIFYVHVLELLLVFLDVREELSVFDPERRLTS